MLFASAFGRVHTPNLVWGRGGRKGGLVFALPPAEPRRNFGSDIFKQTPQFFTAFKTAERSKQTALLAGEIRTTEYKIFNRKFLRVGG